MNAALLSPLLAAEGLRDIRDPIGAASPWPWLLLLTVLTIIAGAIAWFWRRGRKAGPTPALLPHQRAKKRLEQARLRASDPEAFVTEVSQIVREYLEERFGYRAPEETTEEFLEEMRSSPLLTGEHQQNLSSFLQFCDLVKFAGYNPSGTELDQLFETAAGFVEVTAHGPAVARIS